MFVDLFLQVAADFAAHGDGGDCEGGGGGAGGGEKGGVMPSLAEFPWLAVHGRKDGVVPIGKGRLQSMCMKVLHIMIIIHASVHVCEQGSEWVFCVCARAFVRACLCW